MALDGKLMAKARQRLAERKEQNAAEELRRQAEIQSGAPEIRDMDIKLRQYMAQVVGLTAHRSADGTETLETIEKSIMELCAQRAEALVARGYPADYLDSVCYCKKCRDTGYDLHGMPCSCLLELYEEERNEYLSSLPGSEGESFRGFDLNYYTGADRAVMEMTLELCRDYALSFGRDSANLLMRGGTGLGKTFLSSCIARQVASRGFSVVYETAGDAFSAFEDRKFGRESNIVERSEERTRRILDCQLLILDDLGTEMSTVFTHSALYGIINSRLASGRKTIVITNLSAEELAARYTPQVVSRLSGEFDVVPFRGRDIRAIKKEKRYS